MKLIELDLEVVSFRSAELPFLPVGAESILAQSVDPEILPPETKPLTVVEDEGLPGRGVVFTEIEKGPLRFMLEKAVVMLRPYRIINAVPDGYAKAPAYRGFMAKVQVEPILSEALVREGATVHDRKYTLDPDKLAGHENEIKALLDRKAVYTERDERLAAYVRAQHGRLINYKDLTDLVEGTYDAKQHAVRNFIKKYTTTEDVTCEKLGGPTDLQYRFIPNDWSEEKRRLEIEQPKVRYTEREEILAAYVEARHGRLIKRKELDDLVEGTPNAKTNSVYKFIRKYTTAEDVTCESLGSVRDRHYRFVPNGWSEAERQERIEGTGMLYDDREQLVIQDMLDHPDEPRPVSSMRINASGDHCAEDDKIRRTFTKIRRDAAYGPRLRWSGPTNKPKYWFASDDMMAAEAPARKESATPLEAKKQVVRPDGAASEKDVSLSTFDVSRETLAILSLIRTEGDCNGGNSQYFFAGRGENKKTEKAKEICHSCALEDKCLEYAMAANEEFGVWGGKSEKQRRQIRSERHKAKLA